MNMFDMLLINGMLGDKLLDKIIDIGRIDFF